MRLFKSTHKLDFEVHPWREDYMAFKIGTCNGAYRSNNECKTYEILALINEKPGNGHFKDVIEWFENSCMRDGYSLKILEVWNKKFKTHLIKKLGFSILKGTDDVIKHFK